MKSLNAQGKKLISRVGIAIAAILLIGLCSWGVTSIITHYKNKNITEKQAVIKEYQYKVDSIKVLNIVAEKRILELERQIDSIEIQKEYIYIEAEKKDKVIKDASMLTHAVAIDSITGQKKQWEIVNVAKDTLLKYNFTKTGIVNLRLYINSLEKFKFLYSANQSIILKQKVEIDSYALLTENQKTMLEFQDNGLKASAEVNATLTDELRKSRKKAKRWPYWLAGGALGGVILCLSVK